MIKKTVTYEDLNEQTVTEDFYFNMTKLELAETDMFLDGGFEGTAKMLTETNDVRKAYSLFKDILLGAYGKKSPDGRQFIKSPEIRAELENSPALGEIILDLMGDTTNAANFINGLMPAGMRADIEKNSASNGVATNVELPSAEPKLAEEPATADDFTDEELLQMNDDAFDALLPKGGNVPKRLQLIGMKRKQQ